MQRLKKFTTLAVLSVMCAANMFAQLGALGGLLGGLGGGIPVVDNSLLIEQALHKIQLVKQVEEAIKIYNQTKATYDHLYFEAKRLMNTSRYSMKTVPWKGVMMTNNYGRTIQWQTAVNSGMSAGSGWDNATTLRSQYWKFSEIPKEQQLKTSADYAGVEIQDGTAISAIESLGRVRANGVVAEQILDQIQKDAESSDKDSSTQTALLQRQNALALAHAKALSDLQKLAVAQTEMEVVRMRSEREAAAQALQSDIEFRTNGKANIQAMTAGASDAMMSFRLP